MNKKRLAAAAAVAAMLGGLAGPEVAAGQLQRLGTLDLNVEDTREAGVSKEATDLPEKLIGGDPPGCNAHATSR